MDAASMPIGQLSTIDYGLILGVVNWITTIGLVVFVWSSQRRQATRDQIRILKDKVEHEVRDTHARISTETRKTDNRLTRLEEWREQVPGNANVQKLYTELEIIRGEVKQMVATQAAVSDSIVGVKRSVELINEHLLRADKQRTRRSG